MSNGQKIAAWVVGVLVLFVVLGAIFGNSNKKAATTTVTISGSAQTVTITAAATLSRTKASIRTVTVDMTKTVAVTRTVTSSGVATNDDGQGDSTDVDGDSPGSYSHAGDSAFCSINQCIGDFDSEDGYIVECQDGTWSHSGGLPGACSDHGGVS